ncbi:MAG: large subunit ribosomal protein [Solirubrobacteraceae bacterium]|jgi:ribosomal protein L22|nr:large subunit ribosomal protein [Solirubrobacteraceae bacterium]
MTPSKPGDPSQGKPAEAEKAEVEATEAKEAAAVEAAEAQAEAPEVEVAAEPEEAAEAKPRRRSRARKEPEPTAAEATGVGKESAREAAKAAPRRRPEQERVQVRAQAKYVRTSARKARLVCDHIRGKSVQEARAILAHTPRAVARDWSKLLESAVANAEHNHELIGEDLRIASVTADEGPTLKRFRPRAMGRATRIRKRTSHLTILLTPKEF